jgi:hypothetical protein
MVAASVPSPPYVSGAFVPPVSAFRRRMRRSLGTWVIFGVPLFLLAVFAWQVAASNLHTDVAARDAVGISRVSLEADPVGSRIDMVLVDRVGQQTTVSGDINIQLREPDGTVWQSTRSINPSDFVALPGGGLLAGRVGYSVVIPASDWLRAPRRGGAATVSVSVAPTDGTAFTTVAEERFP